jgi:hypothetical protein
MHAGGDPSYVLAVCCAFEGSRWPASPVRSFLRPCPWHAGWFGARRLEEQEQAMADDHVPPASHGESAEQRRVAAEAARDEAERRRLVAERAREAGEAARSAAEAARQTAMEDMQEVTETVKTALEHMKRVEDMRRTLRDFREGGKGTND